MNRPSCESAPARVLGYGATSSRTWHGRDLDSVLRRGPARKEHQAPSSSQPASCRDSGRGHGRALQQCALHAVERRFGGIGDFILKELAPDFELIFGPLLF